MANLNATRYNANPYKPMQGETAVAWSLIDITTIQAKDDTITWFNLPQDGIVIDGWLRGDDLDTGTETYELDIGNSSDTDKYLDSGVLSGDAVAGTKPETGIRRQLGGTLITTGFPSALTAEETVIGTVVAAANAGGTGQLGLWMLYTSA
jgi:hypothetical protein